MKRFSIPYPYVNAGRWGDGKDPFYSEEIFISHANAQRDIADIASHPSLVQLKAYIDYIKGQEQAALAKMGLQYIDGQKQYNLFEAKNFNPATLQNIQNKLNNLKQEYDNATQAFNQQIQGAVSSRKYLSNYTYADFYKFFAQALKAGTSPSPQQVLNIILTPMMQECQRVSHNQNTTLQNSAHLLEKSIFEGYSKILSYFIEVKHDYPHIFTPQQQADLDTLKQLLASKKLLRKTRNTYKPQAQGGKFTVAGPTNSATVTINVDSLLKSIKMSLQQLNKKDIPKAIERLIGKLGSNVGSRGFSGGDVTETFSYKVGYEYDYKFDENSLEEQLHTRKELEMMNAINKRLEDSITRRRTVKTDINLKGYGASIKVGQEKMTKLDTRSSYYSFVNFISQYLEGVPIAQQLLKPNNIHIIINTILQNGNYDSDALNAALSVMAYAFFGATNANFLKDGVENAYFKSDLTKKTNLNENVFIINDSGQITLISGYLENIYNALLMSIDDNTKNSLVQVTFNGTTQDYNTPAELKNPHPDYRQYNQVPELLQSIEISTYIQTYQPVIS